MAEQIENPMIIQDTPEQILTGMIKECELDEYLTYGLRQQLDNDAEKQEPIL